NAKKAISPKKYLLYLNINPSTNLERNNVLKLFKDKVWVKNINIRKELFDYLIDLSESYFVLSPPGMGQDCYRTWEAIFMGSIPIVKSSTL
ncbi:hypothetical protein, partial [Klebsiella pneumoniae]|uniref:hypothetical protein n=1 Tax=Klebsiella pneumoniae TaxID=573 RepID=UPI003F52564E